MLEFYRSGIDERMGRRWKEMKKITINLYEFKELKPEIQDKVIEKYYDLNVEYEWWNYIVDEWKEKLEKLGYYEIEIFFSGFYSQGDGASFKAEVNLVKYVKQTKQQTKYKSLDLENFKAVITKAGHYEHEYTMDSTIEDWSEKDTTEKQIKLINELENEILENSREYARKIYAELKNQYEYLTSRKAIVETIEANEYTFEANGTMRNE